MYLTGVFALLAMAGIGSATPLCDPQTFVPCVMPAVEYFTSPEGQQLWGIKNFNEVNETQMVSVCRMGRTAFQCFADTAYRCIPGDLTELRQFITDANILLDICDRPDLYSKTRLLVQCSKILNETRGSKARSCGNTALKLAMADIRGQEGRSRSDTIERWRNGEIMKKMCCNMKYYETCSGTEVADKCGAQTQQIQDDIHRAIMTVFNCNGARVANCPVRAPPTADDADLEMEFIELMGMQYGGSTGHVSP